MNKKRVIGTLLAAALAVTSLVGCGDSSSGGQTAVNTGAKQTDGKNLPELTTEPMEIILWDIATDEPAKSTQEGAVQRFMADYPNIKITQVHQQNDNYKQQLVVAMSSGQAPNIYVHWGGGPMAEYYNSGYANDITDMYAKYDHPEFIDAAVAQSTYDGKMLAIPFGGLSGCDIFYNKTIFKDLGLEVPQTIDELEDVCDTLKANGITPFSLANASKWTGSMYYMYLVARHSGNAEFDAAYTQENGGTFTSEAFIYAGEKIQDWVKKGYFPDGVNSLSADDNQDRALLYDGSAAMMLHGAWQVSGIKNDNEEWYNENIGVFRFPEDSEAKAKGVPQDVEIGTAIGMGMSFNCYNDDGTVNQDMLDACYVLATQYYNDDTYNNDQLSTGTQPSIKGMEENIDDPNMKIIADVFFNASNVQLWYDQYLPASVTEVHKNCMTELFGLEKTPKEIGEEHDAAMQKALAEQ
ncbi:raffinose/stachyose/melibiose transport system substrate-binding protein [Pseudobutyrivibrio sp. NOR37]|uniref:ABC transporter substrate-binding protein n=2 Tax=Pseudobutyrivibrio TaxID=46205 RepID=A0A2G3E7F5_9FIRM|nr:MULTISPECIES: extracellular solute-binding protein [Pseudobutyrivibrio]NEX00424.1 extracellular solute-binding protein [Pseudobutyrivibrio xylanivorans]PHU39229.1 ABC transporter substrate-binding protein [Pseudobutyrivibrio ruminis]SFR84917.1 raffinose/stachyose/melibiose transport system substrate-binding protein [Pseudobutyrivibrio sp. NOR37]